MRSSNCVRPGEVFVGWSYRFKGSGEYTFGAKRMTKTRADKEGRTIILCVKCDEPAFHIDSSYPYGDDFNLCEKHYLERRKEIKSE